MGSRGDIPLPASGSEILSGTSRIPTDRSQRPDRVSFAKSLAGQCAPVADARMRDKSVWFLPFSRKSRRGESSSRFSTGRQCCVEELNERKSGQLRHLTDHPDQYSSEITMVV
jgi:hypothetical protein